MPAAAGGEDEGFSRAVKETGDKHSFGSRAVERERDFLSGIAR